MIQYEDREKADLRGIIKTGKDGSFAIKASKPVPYPIPSDGPVGKLLKRINRHPYRPAHIHFIIEKPGYDKLITALYEKVIRMKHQMQYLVLNQSYCTL